MAKQGVEVVKRTEPSLPEVVKGLFDLLEPLAEESRQRALASTLALLGMSGQPAVAPVVSVSAVQGASSSGGSDASSQGAASITPQGYFDDKSPKSKTQHLAVAARYLELYRPESAITKDALAEVTKQARRNFDSGNYGRDLDHARSAGVFTRGPGDVMLAHSGQAMVDALPDQDAAKLQLRERRRVAKRAPAKKAPRQATAKKATTRK